MRFEEKKEFLRDAAQTLKENGFRVFEHVNDKWKSMWLIFTKDGNTIGELFEDMGCYTISSSWHPTKEACTGIQVLGWRDGMGNRTLVSYANEALLPPEQSWFARRYPKKMGRIVPMTLEEKTKEYEKLNWSLVEL